MNKPHKKNSLSFSTDLTSVSYFSLSSGISLIFPNSWEFTKFKQMKKSSPKQVEKEDHQKGGKITKSKEKVVKKGAR